MFGSEVLGLRAGESTDRQQLAGPGYWEDGWWVDATPDPLAPSADRPDVLPDDLETWEPGRSLATVVSSADRSRLSGYHLIRLVQAQAKLVAHHQAGLYQSIAQVAALVDDADAAAAEVAAALHLTRAASEAELELAVDLSRLPQVGQVLARGDIDLRRARVIIDNTRGLTPDVANQIVARVMPSAATLTTGQLRARISRLRMEQDTDRAHNEYRAALEDRRIVVGANPDGTANLCAHNLPPEKVMAIRRRLNQLARNAKTPGDARIADQVRADVYCDLLTGTLQTGRFGKAGTVDIVVDLATLTRLDNHPGHIPGYGPVIAEIARKIAATQADCRWQYTVTDQGEPVATGTIRRRPTNTMKRRIRALYPTCIFPGCRMPAQDSDLDHLQPWSKRGKTSIWNLGPLCRYHHQLRDKGWTYVRLPDGTHQFTSPLGHTYTTSGADPP